MKNNIGGFRLYGTIIFLIICLYYLYPSFEKYFVSQKMAGMSTEELATYEDDNRQYLADLNQKALSLGLDLQGGMHVTLEVGVQALVSDLAQDKDATFTEAIQLAGQRAKSGDADFITAFVEEFERKDPNARLSRYFRNPDENITRRSTNAEIATWLNTKANDAVSSAMSIIRDRIDRFGVTEPSIQQQGSRRIVAEMPGITDPDRMRNLLKGTAKLEFRLMGEPNQVTATINSIVAYHNNKDVASDSTSIASDSTATASDSTSVVSDSTDTLNDLLDNQADSPDAPDNALLAVFSPIGNSVIYGTALKSDTAAVNKLFKNPEIQNMIPQDIIPMWTSAPYATTEDTQEEVFALLAVKKQVELTGDMVTSASQEFSQFTQQPEVSLAMNSEGSSIWSRLTGANVNKQVAITMDNVVYSYPNIREKISGGRTSIEGLDSVEEAKDLETVLKSGSLPAPVQIIEERTVGPSLGAASIRNGTWSLLIGFLIVVIFMVFYYRTAGIIANIALLLNVVFIFGILAAFQATLTLPGMAGIVLTIGMAVDANVLIFDRIREEERSGKSNKAAIDSGYSKALSAIADANITTFFVALILFSFGVGPIKGFAVTLMAGIVSSLFTAIVVTRLVTDWMVIKRNKTISYG